jgi:hypothetical protein
MAVQLTSLTMTCAEAVLECPVPTTPLIGYSSESPDPLSSEPLPFVPSSQFGVLFVEEWPMDIFQGDNWGIDDWPI